MMECLSPDQCSPSSVYDGMSASRSGVDEVDIEGGLVDLPHIQGCILLQAFLELSFTVTLSIRTYKRISVSNQGPALGGTS